MTETWLHERKQDDGGRLFLHWMHVISDVLQELVSGPLLFLVFINNLDETEEGIINEVCR